MWKGLLLVLLTISFDYCLTFESSRLSVTSESLKNLRGTKKQKYHVNDKIDYDENYEPADEFEGGKLIGKWRSTGEAIEPKWRDGDSIPLVPFEEAATLRRVPKPKEKTSITPLPTVPQLSAHDEIVNKFHEIQQAKIRYLNAPITEIKPIPEFIASFKDIRNYEVEQPPLPIRQTDFLNPHQNSSRRYRIRKPKPVSEDAETYIREPVVKSSPSSSTEGKQQIIGDRENKKTNVLPERSDITRSKNPFKGHSEYEFNDEEYQRPRPRKRKPPQNKEFSEAQFDPLSQRRLPDGRKNRTRGNTEERVNQRMENSELKSLLKMQQIEGLSLSEILQRRNLTLSDLLKGKSDVIKVLKANDTDDGESVSNDRRKVFSPIIIRDNKSEERPRWRTNPRTRIRIRNQFQTISSTMTTPLTTTREKSHWTETKGDLNEGARESMKGNEGKLKESDIKASTKAIAKLTEANIFARFNSSAKKPLVVSTTLRTVGKEDPVIKYEPKKQLTTVPSIEDDEIMEFSDFSTNAGSPGDKIAITTLKPDITTRRNEETTVITGHNDIARDDGGSTLSIEHILSTEPTKSTVGLDEEKFNTLIEYNKADNDADCNDEGLMDYQNDAADKDLEYDDELIDDEEEYYDMPETTTIIETTNVSNEEAKEEEEEEEKEEEANQEVPLNHRPIPSIDHKRYEQMISEIEPEARAEIFELLSSGSSSRLEAILRSRNMSIDELISLRQRGSSRVHLAGIKPKSRSHKFTEKPDQFTQPSTRYRTLPITTTLSSLRTTQFKIYVEDTTVSPTTTPTLTSTSITSSTSSSTSKFTTSSAIYKIKADVQRNNTQMSKVTDKTPIVINISCTDDKKEEKIHAALDKNTVELVDLLNAFDSLPFAVHKHIEIAATTELNPSIKNEEIKIVNEQVLDSIMKEKDVNNAKNEQQAPDPLEVGSVEEIIKKFGVEEPEATTESDLAHSIHEKEKKTFSKVRPSIIASGVILGMTIVGFLALFITCRIRQKQRYMYKNSFSKAVFQAPAMNGRKLSNSSSLNTIMVNVVATSTNKRTVQQETQQVEETFDCKSDIDHDSLDANDSWETIPDFMK